jgi:hypothetical protein
VLQTFNLKLLTSSSGPRHAALALVVPHGLTLRGDSGTIYNDLRKNMSHICAILKKDYLIYSLFKIFYKVKFYIVTRQCKT